ncbi:MAG: DNA mismatch repair protein MutL, partial [Muribaculaceae bacterium]|nr:DNA mismatch repair protein MutL [Muribaculaceae bacterium]
HARRRGAPQYFFVNGRNMRHPYFHKAVISCYSELIPADMQPIYFIDLEVDPSTIDVNIHPQKHEIKFENEQHIWQILSAAVKQALGKINASGAIDFDVDTMPDIPVFMPDREAQMPGIATEESYNPFAPENLHAKVSVERRSNITPASIPPRHGASQVPDNWDKLYESFATRRDSAVPAPSEIQPELPTADVHEEKQTEPLLDIPETHTGHITVGGKWIVCPARKGMMIIDRQRAHVRILYDRYKASMNGRKFESQKLLFPESITLTPAESTMMSSVADTLTTLGFDVSFLGNCTWAVNAVPAIRGGNAETLRSIISELTETGDTDAEKILHPAALAMARSGAVAPGAVITDAETDAIVGDLLSSPESAYTPDGLPTYTIVEHHTISKMLG